MASSEISPEQKQVIGIINSPRDDTWPLSRLHVDPTNTEIFDPLPAPELSELAKSIKEIGIINPLSVTPEGLIIAGEQRYRAALEAGLTSVPVRIYNSLIPDQITLFRIAENCARRHLKPSETRRAVLKALEITGKGVPSHNVVRWNDGQGSPLYGKRTDVETLTKLSPNTISTHIKHEYKLIEPLKILLDQAVITIRLANKLVTLEPEDQEELAKNFKTIQEDKNSTLRQQQQQFAELTENMKIERAARKKAEAELAVKKQQQETAGDSPELQEEIALLEQRLQKLQEQKDQADRKVLEKDKELREARGKLNFTQKRNDALEKDIKEFKARRHANVVDRFFRSITFIDRIEPGEAVLDHQGQLGGELVLKEHRRILKYLIPWLQTYADEIDKNLGTISNPVSQQSKEEVPQLTIAEAVKRRAAKKGKVKAPEEGDQQ